MTKQELEDEGIDFVVELSCNLPGFVRYPKEGMDSVAEVAGKMIRDALEDHVCDISIPLDTETVFTCLVEVRFDKPDTQGGVLINE